jgi:hypothetical protein
MRGGMSVRSDQDGAGRYLMNGMSLVKNVCEIIEDASHNHIF